MGYALFDPTPYPSVNLPATLGFKVLTANFGDNYSQTAADGINSQADKLDLSWENLTMPEFAAIWAFLKAQGGTAPFYFQVVGTPYWQKWKCNADMVRTFISSQSVSLQITLNEVFDIDPNVASSYAGVPGSALYNSAGAVVVDAYGNYVLTS
jgi:phage-related protein